MDSNVLKKWENGVSGKDVREAIEHNFNLLDAKIEGISKANGGGYTKSFKTTDWSGGTIKINYYEHGISSPAPYVFMLYDNKYIDVQGGVYTDSGNNVYLQSDIAYAGKVVIK